VSGFHGKNLCEGHFAEFLALVQEGSIPAGSVLLIENIDRFSRDSIIPARNKLEAILQAGVEIHTLSPERVYNKESLQNPYELIGMMLEFSRAHEYSQQIGKRLASAWNGKREKAKNNQTPLSKCPPAWLKVVDNKYEVIPDRAQTVELIYQLCAESLGMNLLAQELTRRKIPSFSGKPLNECDIAKILRSEAPIGHHHPYRVDPATRKQIPTPRIEGLYPPVISESLNAMAKIAMRQRRNKGGRVDRDGKIHPFQGLLQSHTGAPLHIKYHPKGRNDPTMIPYLRDPGSGIRIH
jgi:DNA invertase Pin-like site-specific DNA recombinase